MGGFKLKSMLCNSVNDNGPTHKIVSRLGKICDLTVFNCQKYVFLIKSMLCNSVRDSGPSYKIPSRLGKKWDLTVFKFQKYVYLIEKYVVEFSKR